MFIAFENFKLYCGDFNVPKQPLYFTDLFSRSWSVDLQSLNITIIKITDDQKIVIECPNVDDQLLLNKPQNKYCVLLSQDGLYEPIVIAKSLKDYWKPYLFSQFSQELVKKTKFDMVQNIIQLGLALTNCKDKGANQSVKKVLSKYHSKVRNLVYDETFRGIGVNLDNGLFIHTLSFGVKDFPDIMKSREIDKILPKHLLVLLKSELGAINENIRLSVRDGKVIGVYYLENYYDTLEDDVSNYKDYELVKIDMYEANNLNTTEYNELTKKDNIYEKLKNEVSHFFSNNGMKDAREIIVNVCEDPNISDKEKLDILFKSFSSIVSLLVVSNERINYSESDGVCTKKKEKNVKGIQNVIIVN